MTGGVGRSPGMTGGVGRSPGMTGGVGRSSSLTPFVIPDFSPCHSRALPAMLRIALQAGGGNLIVFKEYF